MTREEAIVLIERSVNELKEMMQTITMPQSAAEQLQQQIDAHEMAISSLRQQDHFREVTKKVEPLTMDELRKMDDEPVWVVYEEDAGMWALVEVCEESIFLTNNLGGRTEYAADVELEDDGITVYRQKPEEDKHETV